MISGALRNKRFLIVLAAAAVLIIGVVAMLNRGGNSMPEEENVPELPTHMRPTTMLVPSQDGHYLKLVVQDINVPGASMMEYELLYGTAAGIQQGIPGRVTLSGVMSVDRDLLLGSESSGKFRYDEGVNEGTLTLKFRDVDGKFIGKVVTTWKFYSGKDTQTFESADGKFSFTPTGKNESYYLVMNTFGVKDAPSEVKNGPYGVFTSSEDAVPGEINLSGSVYSLKDGKWKSLSGSKVDNTGIFLSI